MKIIAFFYIYILFIPSTLYCQQSKENYLRSHAIELSENFKFPKSSNVVGFGAYHGSAKTEDAEILIVKSLINNNNLAFYFPETDISIAHYFNEYLNTGNEELLKDLVINYGVRVPQESSREVFIKWKKLKALNDNLPDKKKIKILGADPIVTYKYTFRHLLSLIHNYKKWEKAADLNEAIQNDTTDFSPYYSSYSKRLLREFVADYEADSLRYNGLVKNKAMFIHLIHTVKVSFNGDYNREKEMYSNYLTVSNMFKCKDKQQFFRLGFSHLLKARTGRSGSFFSMLVESNVYPKKNILSVIGYLRKSEVLWSNNYDDDGNFISSVTKGDEGIGDSPTKCFKGISVLKAYSLGNFTLFPINLNGSPYRNDGCCDLIEVVTVPATSKPDFGRNVTTDFLDYALLISNSPAAKSVDAPEDNN